MDKVTKVNCEGRDYGFVAGNVLKGVSGASASDYVKIITLPEGADLVEGCLLAVTFVNGNSAGFFGTQTIYSSNGTTFYSDPAMTEVITFPPEGCYDVSLIAGEEYSYRAYPVLSVNGAVAPFCDSKGIPAGGSLWQAGDTVTMLYMGDRFVAILSTVSQVVAGVDIPPTSDAVFQAIADAASSKGLVPSKTDNAIARWNGTEGALQDSGVTIDDSNNISGGNLLGSSNVAKSLTGDLRCTTAGNVAAKTVALKGFSNYKGAKLMLYIENENTAAGPLTLSVNSQSAKTIRVNGNLTSATSYTLEAGRYNAYYDGTYWNLDSNYEAYSARVVRRTGYVQSGSDIPITSDGVFKALGNLRATLVENVSNSFYVLLYDITKWYNSTSSSVTQTAQVCGLIFSDRDSNGYISGNLCIESFAIGVGYYRTDDNWNNNNTTVLKTNLLSGRSKPLRACVIKKSGSEYYIALEYTGGQIASDITIFAKFDDTVSGDRPLCTKVAKTDYTLVYGES